MTEGSKKIRIKKFIKSKSNKKNIIAVFKIGKSLENYLNKPETIKKIKSKNVKGGDSKDIQNIIMEYAVPELGFTSEKENLFKKYKNNKLRPDFFKRINGSGILIEVERGKTITNNMDLLDLWKCHICTEADHLFLVVPIRDEAKGLNIFDNTCKRMSSFFLKRNYLNIESLIIYGY